MLFTEYPKIREREQSVDYRQKAALLLSTIVCCRNSKLPLLGEKIFPIGRCLSIGVYVSSTPQRYNRRF